jgi:hypothetical protein
LRSAESAGCWVVFEAGSASDRLAPLRGSLRRVGDLAGAEPVKLVRVIHHQPTRLIGSQQTLVKLAGQGGRLGIQRLQLGFFVSFRRAPARINR